MPVYTKRHRQHYDFNHKLRPDHAIQPDGQIHQNQQGNIKKPLSAQSKNGRLSSLSHCLKCIADKKIYRSQRHGQTGNTQEGGAQCTCLCLRNKQMQDLRGKDCKT